MCRGQCQCADVHVTCRFACIELGLVGGVLALGRQLENLAGQTTRTRVLT